MNSNKLNNKDSESLTLNNPAQGRGRDQREQPSVPQGRDQREQPSVPQGRDQREQPSVPQGRDQREQPFIPQCGGKRQYTLVFGLIAAILVVDQIVKIWIKTHFYLGQEIPLLGDWCLLHFVENQGFAFGTSFGGTTGKVILTLFRFVASGALLWYLLHLLKKGTRTVMVTYLALILAGAVGNLIDSCFYGLIFSESTFSVASLFPPEGGYAPFLQGKVVDMFYFPLFEFDWPQWLPLLGGKHFLFFDAIFNVADSAITVGAFWLVIDILIQDHKKRHAPKEPEAAKT